MVAHVACALEDVEEDKARGDRGVQNTQEDQGRDHEAEGYNLVGMVAERAKGWGGVVVEASVAVDNATADGEDQDLADSNSPQSLREVPRLFHLSNEAGQGDLADKSIADVEESVHAINKGSRAGCKSVDLDWASIGISCGVVLDGCEDSCEQHRDEGEDGRCSCKFRQGIECSRERSDP